MTTMKCLLAGMLLCMGISNNCFAVMIDDVSAGANNGLEVGGVDSFIVEDIKLGSTDAELAWVKSKLNTDVEYSIKTENVAYYATDTMDVFAFELALEPAYYIIKNATRIALFQNVASLDWGVFDSMDLTEYMNLPTGGFTISHVTEFGGSVKVPVPEPSSLALLGLGLIGFGFSRRGKQN